MTQVIVCDDCCGFGRIQLSELTNHHKGEYEFYYKRCPKCGGFGRLLFIRESRDHSKEYLSLISESVRRLKIDEVETEFVDESTTQIRK